MRLIFWTLSLFAALAWSGSPNNAKMIPHVNQSFAASFLPTRFRVTDPALKTRLETLFQKQHPDSVAYAVWNGDELQVTPDLALRLGAFSDTARKFHTRVRRTLERLAGSGIEEEPTMSADVYYPNDPNFLSGQQWSLSNTGQTLPTGKTQANVAGKIGTDIGMTKVWDKYDGDDSLVVAVVDAGFNFNHPDLQGKWYRNMAEVNGVAGVDDDHNGFVDDTAGWDFVDNDNLPQDYLGHGSECSGIIAANFDNNTGMAGMVPRIKILPVRVLDATGSGSASNVAKGVQYAVKMHVSAINFSLGGSGASSALQAAFQMARDSGVPVIVAAGNDSVNLETNPQPPSSYKYNNIYTVAAHNQVGALSYFSNWGASTVAIAAPGENIFSTSVPSPTGVGGLIQFQDTIDNTLSKWTFANAGDFVKSALNPFASPIGEPGATSMQWHTSTNTWAATASVIDLTGKAGSTLWFLLDYTPASVNDQLVVEAEVQGTTTWTQIADITAAVTPQWLSYDTHFLDGKKFTLRFRTLATGSVTSRVIILDDIREYYYDALAADNAIAYSTGAGTSFAAPYVTGYIALLRNACKRAKITFTRALALAAATTESALAGKDSTGGRLDAAKGLKFYLDSLPNLTVTDSSKTSWTTGDAVQYVLSVPGAPSNFYAYKSLTSLTGTTLSTTGTFAWNSTNGKVGADTVRFVASASPLVLRKIQIFTLKAKTTAIPGISSLESQPLLWLGQQSFVLPSNFFQTSHHFWVVQSIDANGRSRMVFSGAMETGTREKVSLELSGLDPEIKGPGWRVSMDGVPLQLQRKVPAQ